MVNLTISTTGWGVRPYGGEAPTPECHKAEDIEHRRYVAGDDDRNVVSLKLTERDAMGVAVDLLYQLVDAGVLAGWNTQFPERKYDCGGSCTEKCEHEPCARRS